MKIWSLFLLLIIVGCNSEKADLSAIQGIADPNNPRPEIVYIGAPTAGIYGENSTLDFTVTFSEPVTVTGIPTLPLFFDSGRSSAAYIDGSGTNTLIFRKSVSDGEYETSAVLSSGQISLNGGSINSLFDLDPARLSIGNHPFPGVLINAVDTAVIDTNVPAGTYKGGDPLCFELTYSAPVSVSSPGIAVPFTLSGNSYPATYVSGSGTTSLNFCFTIPAGLSASEVTVGSPLTGTLTDAFGGTVSNAVNVETISGVNIDSIPPGIAGVSTSSIRTYFPGEIIEFIVSFSEALSVSGTPEINLSLSPGSQTRKARFTRMADPSTLVFTYTVVPGDPNFAQVNPASTITLPSASIKDTIGNSFDETTTITYPPLSGLRIDGTPPTVTSRLFHYTPGEIFNTGDTIRFQMNFNSVIYIGGSGTPYVNLNIGGELKKAMLVPNPPANSLIFEYIVDEGLFDNDGVEAQTPIILNGATLKDGASPVANDIPLAFSTLRDTNVIVNSAPRITNIAFSGSSGAYETGSFISITVTFSEPVTISGVPKINAISQNPGSVVTAPVEFSLNGGGSDNLIFTHHIASVDLDGIEFSDMRIDLNGGSIQTSSSDPVNVNFPPDFNPKIYFLPQKMKHWFDASDVTSTVLQGTSVMELNSKISTLTSTLGAGFPPEYRSTDSGVFFDTLSPTFTYPDIDAKVISIVVTAPTDELTTGKKAFTLGSFYLEFLNDKTIKTNCVSCSFWNGSYWVNTIASGLLDAETWAPGEKKIITLKLPDSSVPYGFSIGNNFLTGIIHEMVIFEADTTDTQLGFVHDYLMDKHNAGF